MSALRDYRIEACVVSFEQAVSAFERGANRLEICSRLETEGMTPDISLIEAILEAVSIPVRIMIRETESGFESDEETVEKMKSSIQVFKNIRIDGFVIGLLKNNRLDRESLKALIEEAYPLPVTIHKALDLSENIPDDVHWLNQFPQVDTILTSGSHSTALQGIDEIVKMKSHFRGDIMAAGKITASVLPALHAALHTPWYHGRNIL